MPLSTLLESPNLDPGELTAGMAIGVVQVELTGEGHIAGDTGERQARCELLSPLMLPGALDNEAATVCGDDGGVDSDHDVKQFSSGRKSTAKPKTKHKHKLAPTANKAIDTDSER